MTKNINILNKFNIKNIPDLDVAVLGALKLFQKEKRPAMHLQDIQKEALEKFILTQKL